jgi:hypothetical protein
MTDLEALAKLASEASGKQKGTFAVSVEYGAFLQAASPDVVLALVRVALTTKAVVAAWDKDDVWEMNDVVPALRAALANLDR